MPPQKRKRGKTVKQKKKLLDLEKLPSVTAIHIPLSKRDKWLYMQRRMEEMKQQDTLTLMAVWLVVG